MSCPVGLVAVANDPFFGGLVTDRYVIERELGRGGMATVYLAQDRKHLRRVAIKVLRPEVAATLGLQRFLQEIRIVAQLTHPNILTLIDSGETGGVLYYVMPYVEGESLRIRVDREGQLRLEDALRITREVAEALDYAHRHDVLHRDVKPENILLEDGHAVVADFGIARAITRAQGEGMSTPGIVVGTPTYMSPEACAGSASIDARSDIYAAGCVLYEMLTGEPPYSGLDGQAVMARQINEPLPSPKVLRPGLSAQVEHALETALAKSPADRFDSAASLAAAIRQLETGTYHGVPWRVKRRRAYALALAAGLGLTFLLGRAALERPTPLEADRLVVFPLIQGGSDGTDRSLAEQITIALLNALSSTDVLKPMDGWRLLSQVQRDDVRALPPEATRAIARDNRAGAYLEGRILAGDSIHLSLELHGLRGDSSWQRVLSFASTDDPWTMGLRAATALLPELIPAGRSVRLTALYDRVPAATASFLQGEQAYRRARFADALGHYRRAVEVDSAFALAALRAAQLASWNYRLVEAGELIAVALRHAELLTPRDRQLALGFNDYLQARADSAVHHLRAALATEPEWPEAWMALGEVYTHLIPSGSPLDSLAESAFWEAHRLDPDFAPVHYHLLETVLRRGDLEAVAQLMPRLRAAHPDSAALAPLELMYACVRRSPQRVDWRRYVERDPDAVLEAARSFTVAGLRQANCAEAAWRAVLAHDNAMDMDRDSRHWGALLGLHHVLVAEGRSDELKQLLSADTLLSKPLVQRLYILAALAGADVAAEAETAATHLRETYTTHPSAVQSLYLWHLGLWEAQRGRAGAAQAIADTLAARAASSGARRERLLARSMAAGAALARPDSNAALSLLLTLAPDTGRTPLAWNAWESLGWERMQLAELLAAKGRRAEAYRVAANFDSPVPVPYAMYVPRSLALRIRLAEAVGNRREIDRLKRRLTALGGEDLIRSSP